MKNVKITVKDENGKTVGVYKTSRKNVTVLGYSTKDVKFYNYQIFINYEEKANESKSITCVFIDVGFQESGNQEGDGAACHHDDEEQAIAYHIFQISRNHTRQHQT